MEAIRMRGPDYSGYKFISTPRAYHLTLAHSLLDISGKAVRQPYCEAYFPDCFLLFNGEIYNFKEYSKASSDTSSLLDLYLDGHLEIPAKLLGEYVFVIVDKKRLTVDLYTDTFLTKPCFIARSDNPNEFGLASYPSALERLGFRNICRAEPNSHYRFQLLDHGLSFQYKFPNTAFDLDPKYSTYERFFECLIESVRLRATHGAHLPALSLSSGYDSGAISLALNLSGQRYQTISVHSGENEDIIAQRIALNAKDGIDHISLDPVGKSAARSISADIESHFEPFEYAHSDGGRLLKLHQDQGSIGAYIVARELKQREIRVNLSGAGGDEIYSDYGHAGVKFEKHSEFGGLFPEKINSIFPWKKFYGDTQRSYLFKEEIVFGHFGIESRYPLLDRNLVQEFLWLEPDLKNREYKAPLAAFMRKYDYPFDPGKKLGFNTKKTNLLKSTRARLKQLFRTP
jgi:asparagine synthetase B (glutamine-hydrolysing)